MVTQSYSKKFFTNLEMADQVKIKDIKQFDVIWRLDSLRLFQRIGWILSITQQKKSVKSTCFWPCKKFVKRTSFYFKSSRIFDEKSWKDSNKCQIGSWHKIIHNFLNFGDSKKFFSNLEKAGQAIWRNLTLR